MRMRAGCRGAEVRADMWRARCSRLVTAWSGTARHKSKRVWRLTGI
jgi:hypothetical protein